MLETILSILGLILLLVVAWVAVTLLSNYANCLLFKFVQRQVRVPAIVHLTFFMLGLVFLLLVKPLMGIDR